ncbi:unnamed protein product [Rotaria sp. Silwood1]|nr:unnamed protein product [Rotaria sp. Silwood1]CAF0744714.1 unnamed protein product [Rotaria sp. Silwood1]CAF3336612.1 unnamed protein product [Rotaria sp. Silwood1]CAF3360485.1 unnamed protein product [Rotaria sp. Silwood1]CAF4527736.1 unnamed protein product [Rotaria sp. Silwood1]
MQLQERILQLMKNSPDTLSLTYTEFCHIRNVITRAELENLLFNEKLYTEVAYGKLCFTCRKVHFNLLTFTFGIQCNVCKQKVCRNCVTQIALPKERLNDLPIQAFTPLSLTKSLLDGDRYHSFDTQSPLTPTMHDINYDDSGTRRCSTPGNAHKQSGTTKWHTEPIDICTDCFFLLQQIREKFRQRHISPTLTTNSVSSRSSSFNRSHHSSSRSTSNYNLSTSSSASSIATLLAKQQQRSLIFTTDSISSNLKQTKSAQELSAQKLLLNNDSLPTSITTTDAINDDTNEKVSLSRHNLFLKLQPTYDMKLNNIKT